MSQMRQAMTESLLTLERAFAGLLLMCFAQLQYKRPVRMTSPIQCDHRKHLKRKDGKQKPNRKKKRDLQKIGAPNRIQAGEKLDSILGFALADSLARQNSCSVWISHFSVHAHNTTSIAASNNAIHLVSGHLRCCLRHLSIIFNSRALNSVRVEHRLTMRLQSRQAADASGGDNILACPFGLRKACPNLAQIQNRVGQNH
jgi:hypothetical protein